MLYYNFIFKLVQYKIIILENSYTFGAPKPILYLFHVIFQYNNAPRE